MAPGSPHTLMLLLVTLVLGWAAWAMWEQASDYESLPTIMEIDASGLKLIRPGLREYQWRREQIRAMRVGGGPIPGLDFGFLNTLVISADGRLLQIMHSRSFGEIKWLISELQGALQRDWNSRVPTQKEVRDSGS